VERQGNPPHPEEPPAATGGAAGLQDTQTQGVLVVPLAAAAALDPSVFSRVNATEAIPSTWEERARKAWEYYVEEPLVKNCVNSWRTFAVGDEIKITSDDEDVKWEAIELADRLGVSAFVKDMILQLLVKGDAVGFKRYAKDGKDIEEVICVNPVSVKVKYAQGQLVEARQYPDDGGGEGLDLPVDQVLHLKWDAPAFSPRGNSLVLPAFQSIELLRDYRRAEQAIAKRWATPFRLRGLRPEDGHARPEDARAGPRHGQQDGPQERPGRALLRHGGDPRHRGPGPQCRGQGQGGEGGHRRRPGALAFPGHR
jgi:hypothetical protein